MAIEPDQICCICQWQLQMTDTVCLLKKTGNISDKLRSIFSTFLPFQPKLQSCISWWNHVHMQWLIFYGHLNATERCSICPLITGQCRILQFAKT